jgi:hypothetical protein
VALIGRRHGAQGDARGPGPTAIPDLFWPAWLGGLAVLALLSLLASFYSYFPADLRIAHWIQRDGGITIWGGTATFLRDLGNLPSALVWAAVTVLLLIGRRYAEGLVVFSSVCPGWRRA